VFKSGGFEEVKIKQAYACKRKKKKEGDERKPKDLCPEPDNILKLSKSFTDTNGR
jgi:hypothetical protein